MSNDVRNLTMGELNHIFGGVESCEMPGRSSLEHGGSVGKILTAVLVGFLPDTQCSLVFPS